VTVVLFCLHLNRLTSQVHVHIATFIRDAIYTQCLQSQVILHRMEEGGDVAGWHVNPLMFHLDSYLQLRLSVVWT
jgi:hypothetical protein